MRDGGSTGATVGSTGMMAGSTRERGRVPLPWRRSGGGREDDEDDARGPWTRTTRAGRGGGRVAGTALRRTAARGGRRSGAVLRRGRRRAPERSRASPREEEGAGAEKPERRRGILGKKLQNISAVTTLTGAEGPLVSVLATNRD